MPIALSQAVHKATLLADLRGDLAAAESVLRESLEAFTELVPERIQAQAMLGELLLTHDRSAGVAALRAVVEAVLPAEWEDVVADDVARAKRLLAESEA